MAGMLIRTPKPGATRKFSAWYLDLPLDRAEIDEQGPFEHVVGGQREHVFGRADEAELAADPDAALHRAGAAEVEAAERREAAGKVVLEQRRVRAAEAQLEDVAQRVPPRAVRPFPHQEVLAEVQLAARIVEIPERLLVAQFDQVPFGRREREVAGVVRRASAGR